VAFNRSLAVLCAFQSTYLDGMFSVFLRNGGNIMIEGPVARRVICFTQQVGIHRDFSEHVRKLKKIGWKICTF
jgi:hypothetical protein